MTEYTNTTMDPDTNSTSSFDDQNTMPIFKVMFTVILVVIMFGMGCAVDHKKVIENFKKPVGISVGLVCQIVLMPVLTYMLIRLSFMNAVQGISLMLLGCSPGAGNSNVVTYLINGDISLSVALTTMSNLFALGTFPLWLWIYSAIESVDESLRIPYDALAISLCAMAFPIFAGMYFRYKYPRPARIIPKICAGFAVVVLIVVIISMVVVTKMPFIFSPNTYAPIALLPILGIVISFIITCIPQLKLSTGTRRAIAVEIGIQNSGLSNSVILLTFGNSQDILGQALTIPLLYNVFQSAYILLIVITYRIWICSRKPKTSSQTQNDEDDIKTTSESDENKLKNDNTALEPLCMEINGV